MVVRAHAIDCLVPTHFSLIKFKIDSDRMSWHTNAIFIHADFGEMPENVFRALDLEFELVDTDVTFDEVSSSSNDGIGVSFVNGWTVIFGGMPMFSIGSSSLLKIAKDSDVFEMMLEGSSGTAGFSWYSDGEIAREYLSQEGEIIKDEGEKLALENDIEPIKDNEQFVLQVMIGLTIAFPALSSARFSIFEIG